MSPLRTFDEPFLIDLLRGLAVDRRAAFGLACVERELGRDAGLEEIRGLVELAWQDVAAARVVAAEVLLGRYDSAVAAVPDDESLTKSAGLQQNTAAAAAYVFDAWRTGDVATAVLPARLVYENADERVLLRGEIDVNAPDATKRILAAPELQQELSYQLSDLEVLSRTPAHEAVGLLRRRP